MPVMLRAALRADICWSSARAADSSCKVITTKPGTSSIGAAWTAAAAPRQPRAFQDHVMLGDREPVRCGRVPAPGRPDGRAGRISLEAGVQQQRLGGAEKLLGGVVDGAEGVLLVQHQRPPAAGRSRICAGSSRTSPSGAGAAFDHAEGPFEAAHAARAPVSSCRTKPGCDQRVVELIDQRFDGGGHCPAGSSARGTRRSRAGRASTRRHACGPAARRPARRNARGWRA